jgi:hypothetical protein
MRRTLWVGLILAAIAVTAGVLWRIVRAASSDPLRIGCIAKSYTSSSCLRHWKA